MSEFAVIDFETANEKWCSACAIGIALVRDGVISMSTTYLIRPHEMRFCDRNIMLHGIRPQDVANAPTLSELWPRVWAHIGGKLIVAHNASFDAGVMRHAFHANRMEFPQFDYMCSLALSRIVWPNAVSHSLGILAPSLGIELDHHQAESDARACAEIVLRACSESGVNCPRHLAEMHGLNIGRMYPNGDWVPCSGPSRGPSKELLEIEIPDGFDITSHPFYQKNIVLTGELPYCSRSNAKSLIESLGGIPKSAVSKKTHVLVAGTQDQRRLAIGEAASNKMRKALALREEGIPIHIVTAEDFYAMVFSLPSGTNEADGNETNFSTRTVR